MHLLPVTCLAIVFLSLVSANSLPDNFFGKFSLDHSDNFDEYLSEKGYGWFTRRLVTLSSVDKVITKTGSNTFNFDDLWTTKKLHYKNVELGREFRGKGLDGSIQKAEQKQDEYRFHFEGAQLVQTLESNGVVAKRYFTRQ